jgi:hypothetical protein
VEQGILALIQPLTTTAIMIDLSPDNHILTPDPGVLPVDINLYRQPFRSTSTRNAQSLFTPQTG